MDKVWEDRWSSQMEAWAALAIHTQAKYNNMPQNCQSPSASESSFSVSTRDSPSLSGQSEASPIPGKYMLQSPDMSEERSRRIALFNPETKFSRSISMGSIKGEVSKLGTQQDWIRLEDGGLLYDESIHLASDLDVSAPLDVKLEAFVKAEERLAQPPIGLVHGTNSRSDTSWLSDGTESWASASSRELSWNHFCDGGDKDLHPSIPHKASAYCPPEEGNNFHQNNVGIRQGERVRGTVEQEACNRHHFVTKETDEHTHRTSYAQANEGTMTSCDNDDEYESQHLHSRFDDVRRGSSAYASLAPPRNINTTKVQCDGVRDSTAGLETSFSRSTKESDSNGCASNLDMHVFSESKASYAESASHNKPTRPKSRHSAAVNDKFSSSSLHGYFRFVEQDGSPCYSFSVTDSDEVFFARACKPESQSNRGDGNFVYTFHSRKEDGKKAKTGRKSWLKKERLASSLVGKLEVIESRPIKGNPNIEETHFVLYGERCQQPAEREGSEFSMPTLGSHSRNVKQRDDSHMSMPNVSASQGLIGSHLHEPISRENMLKRGSGDVEAHRSKQSMGEKDRLHMELAAISITTSLKERKVTRNESFLNERAGWGATFLEKRPAKGWGLGFLGKSSEIGTSVQEEPQERQLNETTQDTCESDAAKLQHHTDSAQTYPEPGLMLNEKLTQKPTSSKDKQPKMAVDVLVILPAGHHGLPTNVGNGPAEDTDSYGPTPLLECWKSGGNCDCGGWDIGCGLSVLKAETLKLHKKKAPIALTSRDRIKWISPGKPLQIFTQGNKRKKLLLLEIIQAGLFSLSFQARLSPLQAFATAVAILHQQIKRK